MRLHHFTRALVGATALMLAGCAGGNDVGSPTTTQAAPESVAEVKALVRKRASKTLPVQSVICSAVSDDLAFCVVTFTGPSCQLWTVQGGETTPLPTVDGASGSRTAKGVWCGRGT